MNLIGRGSKRPGPIALVSATVVALVIGGIVVLIYQDGEDSPPNTASLPGFCELFHRLEGIKATIDGNTADIDVPIDRIEENLAQQTRVREEIVNAAPVEIIEDVERVAAFDREFVPVLLDEIRDAGGLNSFVERVQAQGHSPDALGAYFGFSVERVDAYNEAAMRVQRYVDAACNSPALRGPESHSTATTDGS